MKKEVNRRDRASAAAIILERDSRAAVVCRPGKGAARLVAVLLCCMLLSGCGGDKAAEWEAPIQEVSEEGTAGFAEETKEGAGMAESEAGTAAETVETAAGGEADAVWAEPYKEFLRDHNNLLPLLQEQHEGGARGFLSGFYLCDLDKDGTPELLVQKYHTADYIYTYADGRVQLRNRILYDSFADSLFAYDARSGALYSFELDGGTGTDRSTSLRKVELGEAENPEPAFEAGELLYSAAYGGLEQSDGSYLHVEFQDAIPNEDNQLSEEEFTDITNHLAPLMYCEIKEENLEKYIRADYQETDMYRICSLEEYRDEMAKREEAFAKNAPEIPAGQEGLPENIVTMDDVGVYTIYCDLDGLACYRENEVKVVYAEEWKNIYREWLMNIDQQVYSEGISYLDDLGTPAHFEFIDWKEGAIPVLYMKGQGAPHCLTIAEGEVVEFFTIDNSWAGCEFVKGTDYFLCLEGSTSGRRVGRTLYQLSGTQAAELTSAYMESDWEGETIEIQEYSCRQNPVSLEEYMKQTDVILGTGASAQIVNGLIRSVTSAETQQGGPLVYAEGISFELDSIDEALAGF